MSTGFKWSYRLVDRNDKKVCVCYTEENDKFTLKTSILCGGVWDTEEERLHASDLGKMAAQLIRLGLGAPQEQAIK